MDVIVGFKTTKDTPDVKEVKGNNVVKKLRDDIENGRVIKIPTLNGFVWKRVK